MRRRSLRKGFRKGFSLAKTVPVRQTNRDGRAAKGYIRLEAPPVKFDLFDFWRYLLGVLVCSYCFFTAADRAIGLWRLLHGGERYWGLARKYLVIQLLRVRWDDVAWELTQIALWLVVLGAFVWGHRWIPTVD